MNGVFTQSVNHNVITIFLAIIHSSVSLLKNATISVSLMRRTTLQARLKDWPSLVPNKVDISTPAD